MKTKKIRIKFDIGDKIFHKITEQEGIVIDWRVSGSTRRPVYVVSYGAGDDTAVIASEHEIDTLALKSKKIGFKK